MKIVFNIFTNNFDFVDTGSTAAASTTNAVTTFSKFVCGKISDVEEGFDNFIDCCELPITTTRQTIDLGTLDELCD